MQTVDAKTTSQANECTLLELVLPFPPHRPQSLKESPLLLFDCLKLSPWGPFHDNAAPEMLWCTSGRRKQNGSEEALKSGREARISCSHRNRVPESATCHQRRGTMYDNITQ